MENLLRPRPADSSACVYSFQTKSEEDREKWVRMLADESNPSPLRQHAQHSDCQVLLAEAREWMVQVYSSHNPRKLKDVDVLLAEWIGEEERLLQTIAKKYRPEEPPPFKESLQRRKHGPRRRKHVLRRMNKC